MSLSSFNFLRAILMENNSIMKYLILALQLSLSLAKTSDPELPLCPTNIQYFPQNLPMHCRMPVNTSPPKLPPMGFPPMSMPYPLPPMMTAQQPQNGSSPGSIGQLPSGVHLSNPGIPYPSPMPAPMVMPMGMGMQMPMPMPPAPHAKLPVIVMPFYSQDKIHKGNKKPRSPKSPRRPRYDTSSSETSDEDDTSSDTDAYWRGKGRRRGDVGRRAGIIRRRTTHRHSRTPPILDRVLTPVLQYVTNEGYVIFEKSISKNETKNWLAMDKETKRDPNFEFQDRDRINKQKQILHSQVPDKIKIADKNNVEPHEPQASIQSNSVRTVRSRFKKNNNN